MIVGKDTEDNMAMNEDWSSVFLQALTNSMAQSKAENKWNQELAFRDKEFGQKQLEFDWTKGFNEKQLANTEKSNLADWNSKFRQLSDTEANDWNTNFGGMFGMGGDNPYTADVVEKNWVPWTALQAKETTTNAEKDRLQRLAEIYTPDLLPFGYTGAQNAAKVGAVDSSVFDMALANKLGLNTSLFDGSKKLYRTVAGDKAADIQYGYDTNQANNATHMAGIYAGINAENKRYEDSKRGYYQVYEKGSNIPKIVSDMTPSEIKTQYPGATAIRKMGESEGYSQYLLSDVTNNFENKAKNISSPSDVIKYIQEFEKAGGDITQVPWLRAQLENEVDAWGRKQYGTNPQPNFLGQVLGNDKFTEIPQSWRTLDYNDALNQGKLPDDLMKAKELLRGNRGYGANPSTVLGR